MTKSQTVKLIEFKGKRSLVFNVAHAWSKEYIKYNEHNIDPVHI